MSCSIFYFFAVFIFGTVVDDCFGTLPAEKIIAEL
jgi:hypothetical protein